MESTLVVGIGNRFRGDDAAGLMVADLLDVPHSNLTVVQHEGDGAALIHVWSGYERVVLVDAVLSGAPPGTIHEIIDLRSIQRSWFGPSTHTINVAEALELASLLGMLPKDLTVLGIEGASFDVGSPVSPAVEEAVRRVAREIRKRWGG